jgi:serine/threonine protein phosphatase PrpC
MPKELADSQVSSCSFFWGAASGIGKIRDENQDTFFVNPELALFLVSDGMGGHHGGAVASKTVAEVLPMMIETKLKKLRTHSTRTIRSMLNKTIPELNRHILAESTSGAGCRGMGATLVMALLMQGRCFIVNVGDSRLYLLRKNRLSQMTKDHSVVSELLRQGQIELAQSQNHPHRGQLTHYIGMEQNCQPYLRTVGLKQADRFLLCTDGLTELVPDERIAAILRHEADAQSACQALVDTANAAGGYDNITTVVVDWLND